MTKNVITANPQTTIEHAIKMMINHNISGLAVVDNQGNSLGVYSEWDAMIQGSSQTLTEKIAYHAPAITATEDTLFRDVLVIFITKKVKRVLITDSHNKLLGIMSRSAMMKCIFKDFEQGKNNG
jgi:CBS domain-containing protein